MTRFTGIASIVVFGLFIAGMVSAWARRPRMDRDRFSAGADLAANERPQYVAEIVRDLGLIVMAGYLAFLPGSRGSVDALLLDGRRPA